MDEEEVILVNKKDIQLGLMPKMEAHRKGVLHRAFSVFIFKSSRELLIQKRSSQKYHSPGLWTNTCLLYTSPSPRDVEESRMPSSA